MTLTKMNRENSLYCFKTMRMLSTKKSMKDALDKLIETSSSKKDAIEEMSSFTSLYENFLVRGSEKIDWNKINPPPERMVKMYDSLEDISKEDIKILLEKLVVLKLNGGLGTTMGCKGPKSVIEVREDMTFLDLTVRQIEWLNEKYEANVPLLLMNSFNTHEQTEKIIQKYASSSVVIQTFNQSRFPRISKETLLPCTDDYSADCYWYPPGHGDVYQALKRSGLLDELISDGKEIIFISNIDNLGATVDLKILKHFHSNSSEFIMEVTDKTHADIKGGTLINYEGKCRLLEIAQVPKENEDEFKSLKKFRIFNTNNLWLKMKAIDEVLSEKKLDLDIIVNEKLLNGMKIIQLETACGSAIQHFKDASGINVPRARFLPVKTCSDLFIVKSNLYSLQHGCLIMNPERPFPAVPLVKLGDEHFKTVESFMSRFPEIPNIVELNHLTVTGDVTFGKAVILKGTVIIVANHGNRIDIPSGTILENKVVSGNLRIMDH